jgi:DnaJ family protein C protein 7
MFLPFQAAQIDPSNKVYISRLFCNCANAYARLKNHQKAVESATAAIKADPTYAKAYMRRASSLFDIGGVENLEACQKDYDNVANMLDEAGQNDVQRKLRDVKAALKQARRKDFYKILGISRSADENEIKKAYRKCALKYHPDKAAGKSEQEKEEAEKIFRDVGEAYEVLSDPAKKQRYDSGVDLEDLDNPHAGHHHHGGFGGGGMHGIDPHILFQMFAQQQAARGGMGGSQGMPFSF